MPGPGCRVISDAIDPGRPGAEVDSQQACAPRLRPPADARAQRRRIGAANLKFPGGTAGADGGRAVRRGSARAVGDVGDRVGMVFATRIRKEEERGAAGGHPAVRRILDRIGTEIVLVGHSRGAGAISQGLDRAEKGAEADFVALVIRRIRQPLIDRYADCLLPRLAGLDQGQLCPDVELEGVQEGIATGPGARLSSSRRELGECLPRARVTWIGLTCLPACGQPRRDVLKFFSTERA